MSEPAAFLFQTSSRTAKPAVLPLSRKYAEHSFLVAVKTGRAKTCATIGPSVIPEVHRGVWAGNFSGSSMWNVTGIHGAAKVWLEIMNYLHDRDTSERPAPPEGVVRREVKFRQSGQTVQEYFLVGTDAGGMKLSRGKRGQVSDLIPSGSHFCGHRSRPLQKIGS